MERAGADPVFIKQRIEELREDQLHRRPSVLVEPVRWRQNVIQRDMGLCRYCGEETYPAGSGLGPRQTIDHVIPKSKGGTNGAHNTVCACWGCNHRKKARTPEEAGMPLLPIGTTAQMLLAMACQETDTSGITLGHGDEELHLHLGGDQAHVGAS